MVQDENLNGKPQAPNWATYYPLFQSHEFVCGCGCGLNNMTATFLNILYAIRFECGFPMSINSGCRCPKYNSSKEVRGKPNSAHLRGMAADVRCFNAGTRFKIVEAAMKYGIRRIGPYRTFIHLDNDSSLPQEVMFT